MFLGFLRSRLHNCQRSKVTKDVAYYNIQFFMQQSSRAQQHCSAGNHKLSLRSFQHNSCELECTQCSNSQILENKIVKQLLDEWRVQLKSWKEKLDQLDLKIIQIIPKIAHQLGNEREQILDRKFKLLALLGSSSCFFWGTILEVIEQFELNWNLNKPIQEFLDIFMPVLGFDNNKIIMKLDIPFYNDQVEIIKLITMSLTNFDPRKKQAQQIQPALALVLGELAQFDSNFCFLIVDYLEEKQIGESLGMLSNRDRIDEIREFVNARKISLQNHDYSQLQFYLKMAKLHQALLMTQMSGLNEYEYKNDDQNQCIDQLTQAFGNASTFSIFEKISALRSISGYFSGLTICQQNCETLSSLFGLCLLKLLKRQESNEAAVSVLSNKNLLQQSQSWAWTEECLNQANELSIVLFKFVGLACGDEVPEERKVLASNSIHLLARLKYSFRDKDLRSLQIMNTSVAGCDFTNAKLGSSVFNHVDITGCNFEKTELNNCNWNHTKSLEGSQIRKNEAILSIAMPRSGGYYVIATEGKNIYIEDSKIENNNEISQSFNDPISIEIKPEKIEISPDGQYIAFADRKSCYVLLQAVPLPMAGSIKQLDIKEKFGNIITIKFQPSIQVNVLVVAQERRIQRWDVTQLDNQQKTNGLEIVDIKEEWDISSMDLSPSIHQDPKKYRGFITLGGLNRIWFYRFDDLKWVSHVEALGQVTAISYRCSEKYEIPVFATGESQQIVVRKLWHDELGKFTAQKLHTFILKSSKPVKALKPLGKSNFFVCAQGKNRIELFCALTGKHLSSLPAEYPVNILAPTADGQRLAIVQTRMVSQNSDQIDSIQDGELQFIFSKPWMDSLSLSINKYPIFQLSLSSSNRFFASASLHDILVTELDTQKVILYKSYQSKILKIQLLENSKHLVVLCSDKLIYFYSLELISSSQSFNVFAVNFHPLNFGISESQRKIYCIGELSNQAQLALVVVEWQQDNSGRISQVIASNTVENLLNLSSKKIKIKKCELSPDEKKMAIGIRLQGTQDDQEKFLYFWPDLEQLSQKGQIEKAQLLTFTAQGLIFQNVKDHEIVSVDLSRPSQYIILHQENSQVREAKVFEVSSSQFENSQVREAKVKSSQLEVSSSQFSIFCLTSELILRTSNSSANRLSFSGLYFDSLADVVVTQDRQQFITSIKNKAFVKWSLTKCQTSELRIYISELRGQNVQLRSEVKTEGTVSLRYQPVAFIHQGPRSLGRPEFNQSNISYTQSDQATTDYLSD